MRGPFGAQLVPPLRLASVFPCVLLLQCNVCSTFCIQATAPNLNSAYSSFATPMDCSSCSQEHYACCVRAELSNLKCGHYRALPIPSNFSPVRQYPKLLAFRIQRTDFIFSTSTKRFILSLMHHAYRHVYMIAQYQGDAGMTQTPQSSMFINP
jgi:hypothetical protein